MRRSRLLACATRFFLFELAGVPFSVAVGDFVHAPSNQPHVFQNTSDKDARMLVIAKPGGLENYFVELAERAMRCATSCSGVPLANSFLAS